MKTKQNKTRIEREVEATRHESIRREARNIIAEEIAAVRRFAVPFPYQPGVFFGNETNECHMVFSFPIEGKSIVVE